MIQEHGPIWTAVCSLADRHKPEAVTFRAWLAGITADVEKHGGDRVYAALTTVLTTPHVRNPYGLLRAVIDSPGAPRGRRQVDRDLAPDAKDRLRERYPEMFT